MHRALTGPDNITDRETSVSFSFLSQDNCSSGYIMKIDLQRSTLLSGMVDGMFSEGSPSNWDSTIVIFGRLGQNIFSRVVGAFLQFIL